MEGKNNKSGIQKLEAKINSDIERFSQEYYFAGMDRYIPYIIEKPSAVIDYIRFRNTCLCGRTEEI